MTDLKKVNKLVGKLQYVIEELENRPDVTLHQQVNQFYYMQKSTELQLLHDQLKELIEKEAATRLRLTNHYMDVFSQWKKDSRWLNYYLNSGLKSKLLNHNRLK